MKVLFVNITRDLKNIVDKRLSHPYHILPPLDIGYCASILEKKGHEILFIDTAIEQVKFLDMCDKIIKSDIDIVVLKPNIMTYHLTLDLANKIKLHCRYIICMGPVASTSQDFFIFEESPIDLCIVGEPESTLDEIIERINEGKEITNIAGTSYFDNKFVAVPARNFCNNLDVLPFPKHELFTDKGYSFRYPVRMNVKEKFAAMLSSRGCPNACIFCSPIKRVSFGKTYRARSPENVVNEIELLKSKGINFIYFIDDLFTFDYKRVASICDHLKDRKLKMIWAAQIRADSVDSDLLNKMKDAGCGCVYIGIESANDRALNMLKKGLTLKDIERTVKLCQKIGINTVGGFIIGIPGQTREDLSEDLKFAKRLCLDLVEVLLFIPYPESKAFEMYGRLEHRDMYSHYDEPVISHCELDINELKRARLKFYRAYYFDLRFIFSFIFKNKERIIRNLFSNFSFIKNVLLFLFQKHN